MVENNKHVDDELLMKSLRDIILYEDREELSRLRNQLQDEAYLSARITPFLEERLQFFKENFSEEYKAVVDQIVLEKMKSSKDELLEVIYPEMGKMIRKFIALQFQMLKESIDAQIKKSFSFKNFFRRKKTAEEILSQVDRPVIEEVYVIQRDSGLLLGHASKAETINSDLIAGMLTAIKAFVEDAFRRQSEDLEMIEYGTYKIFIQSFHSYYVAVAMTGSLSAAERDQLSAHILNFASDELQTK
ncbi:MAG: hypothetical protein AAFO94_19475, partial [Bacteroidota bacterium]